MDWRGRDSKPVAIVFAVAAALAVVGASAARSQGAPLPHAVPSQASLLRFERDWTVAEARHDTDALERMLDDRFAFTFGAGSIVRKAQFIGFFAGPAPAVPPTDTVSDETVILNRTVGVTVYTYTHSETTDGQVATKIYRGTTTYLWRRGRWTALAEHLVAAKP